MDYYIVSIKHTKREDLYIMFWHPNDAGYTYSLPRAGLYAGEKVAGSIGYYNSGESTVAVSMEAVEKVAIPALGDLGRVVPNTEENWCALMKAAIAVPARFPKIAILQKPEGEDHSLI